MHKLLDEYLCKKYPKIFADRRKPMTETCMCWGFPGYGWFHILDNLCYSIQSYINHHNEWVEEYELPLWKEIQEGKKESVEWLKEEPKLIPQVVADQVKEKFGTLRFYYHGGDEKIRGMVELVENFSARVCEECGRVDELVNQNSKGWIRTTCPCCTEDRFKEAHLENRRVELVEIWKKVRSEPPISHSEKIEEAFKTIEEIKGYGKQ
jgi:hypothetical protein